MVTDWGIAVDSTLAANKIVVIVVGYRILDVSSKGLHNCLTSQFQLDGLILICFRILSVMESLISFEHKKQIDFLEVWNGGMPYSYFAHLLVPFSLVCGGAQKEEMLDDAHASSVLL